MPLAWFVSKATSKCLWPDLLASLTNWPSALQCGFAHKPSASRHTIRTCQRLHPRTPAIVRSLICISLNSFSTYLLLNLFTSQLIHLSTYSSLNLFTSQLIHLSTYSSLNLFTSQLIHLSTYSLLYLFTSQLILFSTYTLLNFYHLTITISYIHSITTQSHHYINTVPQYNSYSNTSLYTMFLLLASLSFSTQIILILDTDVTLEIAT